MPKLKKVAFMGMAESYVGLPSEAHHAFTFITPDLLVPNNSRASRTFCRNIGYDESLCGQEKLAVDIKVTTRVSTL
jgi:hypothetical protein